MRYINVRTVVNKLFDGELKTPEDIIPVLTSLKDGNHNCDIKLEDGINYKQVRILEVNSEDIVVRIMLNSKSSLKKTWKFDDIRSISVETWSGDISRNKEKSRFSMLDVIDI